jgi:hypothetical protein
LSVEPASTLAPSFFLFLGQVWLSYLHLLHLLTSVLQLLNKSASETLHCL